MNAVSKKTFPTINPVTGKKIADVAEGDKVCLFLVNNYNFLLLIFFVQEDINLAVKAAQAAFERGSEWRNLNASARGKLIHKVKKNS